VRIPASKYPVERLTLPNGLRVVLTPDRAAPVVGVAVVYDVGIRSEPQGRTGFAHLFEHLMFQGSESLEKLAHFRYVQGSGGTFNGSTHFDYTDYFETLPSNALERALFLEADRMRSPRLTEENLRNQVDVVKEEIRVNVLNRPYGGFPWLRLPPVMFDTFANAHDGYGSFDDLESATVADAADFFDRYYACGNAVLAVSGDFDVATATALIERHFGDVPARPAPTRPDFTEPDLTAERRSSYEDRLAPLPAVAAAWRVPDPIKDLEGYLPYVVLAEVLTDGDASRLVERLVLRDRTVTILLL
jgi:zinc protease